MRKQLSKLSGSRLEPGELMIVAASRILLTLMAVLFLQACATSQSNAKLENRPERPNIVYILADDLGYGDVGAYGQEYIMTPNIDRLAREGLRFTRHYSGSTVCAPSRATLMTGLNTGRVSVRGNLGFGSFLDEEELGQMPLSPHETTIAEALRSAGYATAMVGKWGLGGPNAPGEPQERGFDYAFGYLDHKQAHNYYPTHLWENGQSVPLDNRFFIPHANLAGTSKNASDYRQYMGNEYAPDRITAAAVNWLSSRTPDQPFFLYLAFTAPHAALQVPDEELSAYADLADEPLNDGHYTPHPRPRAARAGMISRMDRDIGKVIDALKQGGFSENTLVIFSSDNGPSREGGGDIDFFESTGGLRGEKRDLYEGGIRVPMIAWWPGKVEAGSTTDHVSAFWDVFPTLAELAGASLPTKVDGISFVPTLLGQPQRPHSHLYWEFVHASKGAQAVMMGDWKLIRHRPSMGPDHQYRIELFNIKNDPTERLNLVSEHPDIVEQGLAYMMETRTPSSVDAFNFVRR